MMAILLVIIEMLIETGYVAGKLCFNGWGILCDGPYLGRSRFRGAIQNESNTAFATVPLSMVKEIGVSMLRTHLMQKTGLADAEKISRVTNLTAGRPAWNTTTTFGPRPSNIGSLTIKPRTSRSRKSCSG